MNERGLLISGAIIPPILSGDKTRTRRLINPQPALDGASVRYDGLRAGTDVADEHCLQEIDGQGEDTGRCRFLGKAPWAVGDRLWVRETHQFFKPAYNALGERTDTDGCVRYEADNTIGKWVQPIDHNPQYRNIRPSRFMPKAAARIWITVTVVWAEPLTAISLGEDILERIQPRFMGIDAGYGLAKKMETGYRVYSRKKQWAVAQWTHSPVTSFESLWGQLHGPDSWQQNPWGWVLAFKRITPESDSALAGR